MVAIQVVINEFEFHDIKLSDLSKGDILFR